MKIAGKKDVWHLVQRGMLMTLHFDMETFGLDRDFAQISAYGDALGDIGGNLVDSTELNVKRPDRYLPDIHALLVTRTAAQELDEPGRVPHPDAMGKIAQRFEHGAELIARLPLNEKNVRIETFNKHGKGHRRKIQDENVLEYPLKGEDGEIVNDVRYHPDRKRISYRVDEDSKSQFYENVTNNYYMDKDGSKWKFVEPRLLVSGYRVKWADMAWMRANLVKAGFHPSNVFFAYSRATITDRQKAKNFAVDAYSVALATHTFGPQGEEGLKLGMRTDRNTGEKVPSATLSLVMEANSRQPNPQRGIKAGVLMSDGTLYQELEAHRSPAYDAQASFALYHHTRTLAPTIVRALEAQADEQELRRILPGTDPDVPPVFAMMRNSYPLTYPLADPVTSLGFDDQLGQMRKAIIVRLDKDLATYMYKGKTLEQMDEKDFADMISDQARTPEGLVRTESVRRWPGVIKLEDALKAGGGGVNWDFDRVDTNFRYLVQNPEIVEKIRGGVEILNHRSSHRPDPANPMMEEQGVRNGFGDLDYLQSAARDEQRRRERGGHGAVSGIVETLYNKASDIYNYHRTMDALLHSVAIQPHPVDWSNDDTAIGSFYTLLKRARQKFKKKDSPYKSALDDPWVDKFLKHYKPGQEVNPEFAEKARAFRWKMAKKFLTDDTAERGNARSPYSKNCFDRACMDHGRLLFANLSRDFHVVDKSGRELGIDYLKEQHGRDPKAVLNHIKDGTWHIQFYRLSAQPSIAATLFRFADKGKMAELPPRWQFEYAALQGHYLWGPPNAEPSAHRWPTIPRIERDIAKLELNARVSGRGKDPETSRIYNDPVHSGEADVFMRGDESPMILAKMKSFLDKIKRESPLRDVFNSAANFEPKSGLPYDWIPHELDGNNIVVISVPDTHLRRPLDHIGVSSPYSLVIPKVSVEDRKKIKHGAAVVLKGEQTGRLYYGGPVDLVRAPKIDQGFQDYYRDATRAYTEAGMDFPAAAAREVLVIETLKPLVQTRRHLDSAMQSVKVPALFFDALVSPRLSHMPADKPLTGLVLPVNYSPQELQPGQPIRFREMQAPLGAKLEGVTGKDTGQIYESTLQDVRRLRVGDLGNVDIETAQRNGFASPHEMWEQVHRAFLNQESVNPNAEEVYVLKFSRVKKSSWAYFNPPEAPKAALVYDGKPVPPSAYRPAIHRRLGAK
jgi:hypothetical protein